VAVAVADPSDLARQALRALSTALQTFAEPTD
jgi:hypothetical protein